MNKHYILLLLLNCISILSFASKTGADAHTALLTAAKKLDAIKQISYTYKREINNYNDNYFDQSSADCFVDFNRVNTSGMFRFQFKSDHYQQIFNGVEYFELDGTDKTLTVTEKTTAKTFSSLSQCYNSIPTLKNMFYILAADDSVSKSLKDTVMDGKAYGLIQLSMHNKAIDYLNGYRYFKIDITIYYKIIIDPKTGLPYQVIETNSVDQQKYYTKTTFLNVDTSPQPPDQNSWYYSTYQNDYRPKAEAMIIPLIRVGDEMAAWTLPLIKQNRSISRDDLKGKIVMMDFWIKNCAYCMASFPDLKVLQGKYGKDNFQLLAVNAYDGEKEVEFFYNREKPSYLMVYDGIALAKKIGIQGYPQIVITGKTGKVIYSGVFDRAAVEQVIENNL